MVGGSTGFLRSGREPVKQETDSKQRLEPIEKQLAETPLWP